MFVKQVGHVTIIFFKVVVDASGCSTSKKLMKNDQHFTELKEIQNMLGISLKFIHVVANPFEEIALNGIKKSGSKGQVR